MAEIYSIFDEIYDEMFKLAKKNQRKFYDLKKAKELSQKPFYFNIVNKKKGGNNGVYCKSKRNGIKNAKRYITIV